MCEMLHDNWATCKTTYKPATFMTHVCGLHVRKCTRRACARWKGYSTLCLSITLNGIGAKARQAPQGEGGPFPPRSAGIGAKGRQAPPGEGGPLPPRSAGVTEGRRAEEERAVKEPLLMGLWELRSQLYRSVLHSPQA